MSDLRLDAVYIPYGYITPSFPSLNWPRGSRLDSVYYLYYRDDIWRFTLYWTMIAYTVVYGAAGLWAALMCRRIKSVLIIVFYMGIGVLQAVISGSIIGAILGLIYSAGSFTMSTWIPFVWAIVQILVMITISYSMSAVVL
ncbi:hypothetical protein V1512DRAFT_264668 [Lipomyces arxii]|uniref:uncharacterized protein n=1 Tax=Lipomyces arxii TaxID=56418 RepID=UPI0034CE3D62